MYISKLTNPYYLSATPNKTVSCPMSTLHKEASCGHHAILYVLHCSPSSANLLSLLTDDINVCYSKTNTMVDMHLQVLLSDS